MPSTIELISVPADFGRGANDGAYYPVGLLSIGTHLKKLFPTMQISIVDEHHDRGFQPTADVVGISASSTLNYRNVLALAKKAKTAGASVVLGGPHATLLSEQILKNRNGLIDYVIRGNGEEAFSSLLHALQYGLDLQNVPNLSWRGLGGEIYHNPIKFKVWKYDNYLPLDMSLLKDGLNPYWKTFQTRLDSDVDAVFVVFTHFGCGYRENMKQKKPNDKQLTPWCSYCSLNESLLIRKGNDIVNETLRLIRSCNIPKGSKILLKCYGDNVGTQYKMLSSLASAIELSPEWNDFQIGWTFYSQSNRVSQQLIELLVRVGTRNLYIGFDSADDEVQKQNGLATSIKTHRRAIYLCKEYEIRIQAGFVLGCAGETQFSLHNTLRFAEELASQNILERVNSAVLFIIPGSPAYSLLCDKETWISDLDKLPTEELQWYWVKHFCPDLGKNPSDGLEILQKSANYLDELSPGPHSSMGFISDRLRVAQAKYSYLS